MDRGSRKGLIDRSPKGKQIGSHEHVRVASAGVYTARMLACMFAYIDAVVIDTPIVDDSYRRFVTMAHDLSSRLRRTEYFRLYLDKQWRKMGETAHELPFNWEEYSGRLREDVEHITRKNHS